MRYFYWFLGEVDCSYSQCLTCQNYNSLLSNAKQIFDSMGLHPLNFCLYLLQHTFPGLENGVIKVTDFFLLWIHDACCPVWDTIVIGYKMRKVIPFRVLKNYSDICIYIL